MIQVENVTKRYGKHIALNNISFTINEGEILGFLGPNGAGKSTAMNIITGYTSASHGSVKVDGLDILEHPYEVKKKIGYLPELPPLYMDMTVEEYLSFVSKIKLVAAAMQQKNMEKIMDLAQITDVRKRLIKNLSKGYRQRVGLAQAIIGNPEVLVLDEPTVGLDPKQIIEIRNLIKELGKEHTVILSSHILSEVSAVCDRVLIINKGEIVANGTPEELSQKINYSNKILLRVKGNETDILKRITHMANVGSALSQGVREKDTLDILVEAKSDTDIRESLFITFSDAKMPILMMKPMDLTLEEVFLQVTAKDKESDNNAGDI